MNNEEPDKQTLHTQNQYRLIEVLSSSEIRYQHLLNTLSEVLFTLDENYCFKILNQAWQVYTGFNYQGCIGKKLQKFMPDQDFARFKSLVQSGDFREEFQFFDNQGKSQWFEVAVIHIDNNYFGTMIQTQIRKHSDWVLNNTEQQLRMVVENLAEILFQVDQQLRICFLNPAWQDITGFKPEDILGQCLSKFLDPEDAAMLEHLWLKQPVGQSSKYELRLLCHKGQFRWMSVQVRTLLDDNSGALMISGAMLDIHERKLMEESLRRSEERYALLASSTTDGIWDWDLNTDQVYFSPRWKEMLGYEDAELENVFSTWHNRVHPDDIALAMDDVMACLEGKRPTYENIHRMLHRDGYWLWILDRGIALRNEQGLPYRMVGSHADVSSLKDTEQALQRREQDLEAVIGISPDGIVTVSHLGRIQNANPAFLSMTCLNQNQLLGLTEQVFDEVLAQISLDLPLYNKNANTGSRLYCIDLKKLRSHPLHSQSSSIKGEANPRRPKMRVLSRVERNLQCEGIAKVMYFRDISVEYEVDQMKSQFLSTAAHELRTPMASVFGFTELLLSREFDVETRREILHTIHQQSESLVNMLNQLLDLARIESRMGLDFCFVRQPLAPIIQRAVTELLIPGDNRLVKLSLSKSEFWVDVDADKLRQAISNVLANAYKYSPHGGDISLMLIQKPARLTNVSEVGIVISDHGLGMTKEQLKHVFDRFWRANHGVDIPGTGLGMSLVKEVMEIHQGRVVITSKPGKGTRVTLWLKQT